MAADSKTPGIRVLAIAAMAENRVIGRGGEIPWRVGADMRRFKELTMGHTVLMGRKTWQSLPAPFRPLPGRRNVVVTGDPERLREREEVEACSSAAGFIEDCRSGRVKLESDKLWVIGGARVYRETMPLWDELYLTLVHAKFEGDAYFPEFEADFELLEEEQRGEISFKRYVRKAGRS